MNLIEAVRREAQRRRADDRAALRPLPESDWKAAESALIAEVRASPQRGRPLVDAFARLARAAGTREAIGRAARRCAPGTPRRGHWR